MTPGCAGAPWRVDRRNCITNQRETFVVWGAAQRVGRPGSASRDRMGGTEVAVRRIFAISASASREAARRTSAFDYRSMHFSGKLKPQMAARCET